MRKILAAATLGVALCGAPTLAQGSWWPPDDSNPSRCRTAAEMKEIQAWIDYLTPFEKDYNDRLARLERVREADKKRYDALALVTDKAKIEAARQVVKKDDDEILGWKGNIKYLEDWLRALRALKPCPPKPPATTDFDRRLWYRLQSGARPGSGEEPEVRAEVASWTGGGIEYAIGGNIGGGWSRNTYSDFPTFNGSGAGGGIYGAARYYVQPNFYVGPEAGFMLLDINARNQDTAFAIVHTDVYLGGQAGVTLRGPGASKINIYTGVDADWSRIKVGVEAANERMSKTLGGWSVHGGVEMQPSPAIPNLWLGLDLRHSDVSGTIGVDPTHVRWNMLSVTLSIHH
jgi:hypothetical protein